MGAQLLSLIPVIPAIIFTYWLIWKKREREYQEIKKTWRD
jgi:preprotein translocase subunit YajC